MSYIIYPTLDLYLYDLRNGLGDTSSESEQKKANFLRKLPTQIHTEIQKIDNLFEIEYLELIEQQILQIFTNETDIEGYSYPVRLHDTYGLLLDCSVKDKTSPQTPAIITQLKNKVDKKLKENQPTLGKTWMILGQFYESNSTETEILNLAQQCYQALIPNANWEKNLKGSGKVLDGTLFELEQDNFKIRENSSLQSKQNIDVTQNNHVVIILYPSLKLAEKTASLLIEDWMRLWCYRHKILWAYHTSKILKRSLKQKFTNIREYIKQFQNNEYKQLTVEELEQKLNEAGELFAKYGIELTELDYQNQTIDINLKNYENLLERIQQKLSNSSHKSDLACLKQLTDLPFLAQAQKDAETLSPGLTLLEFAVNLIQAEVEIKRTQLQESKTESDRRFQTQFAIWGTAIAIGAIVADISEQFPTVIVPTVTVSEAEPPDANLAAKYPVGSVLSHLGLSEMWLAPGIALVSGVSVTLMVGILLLGVKTLIQKTRSQR